MPTLHITVPYQIPQAEALRRIRAHIAQLKEQHADKMSGLDESWNGYAGQFSASGMGQSASGKILVNPSEVIVEMTLPFAATFFQGKIEAAIRENLTRLLA